MLSRPLRQDRLHLGRRNRKRAHGPCMGMGVGCGLLCITRMGRAHRQWPPWDETARVWDVATGREIAVLRGHRNFVYFAAFSPDGARIVTTGLDGNVRIWKAETAEQILLLRDVSRSRVTAYFSPYGRRILTPLHDYTAVIWDAAAGSVIISLKGHKGEVYAAAYNRDGTRIVTASSDMTARIWDAATGNEIAILWNEGPVRFAAFSPDGSQVVAVEDISPDVARIWNVATAEQRCGPARRVVGGFQPGPEGDGARSCHGSFGGEGRAHFGRNCRTCRRPMGWCRIAVLRGHTDRVWPPPTVTTVATSSRPRAIGRRASGTLRRPRRSWCSAAVPGECGCVQSRRKAHRKLHR